MSPVVRGVSEKTSISHQNGVIYQQNGVILFDANDFPITFMHENQDQVKFSPQYQVKPSALKEH